MVKPLGVALLLYDRTAPQEKQEARTETAGFLLRVSKKRRYADLGYLLPFYLRLAVQTRCIGPSPWHTLYIYRITVRTFGYAPVGHGARPQPTFWPSCRFRHQENEEACIGDAGFPNQVLIGRGNAPTSIGVSAHPRSCFSYIYPSIVSTIGYASVGHGTQREPICMSWRTYTGLTFSAHGPFLPLPSVKDTFWPSRSSSKLTPWTLDEWKNKSFAPPVLINPNPLSVNLLMVPSAICAFPVVIAWTDAARLTIADWSPSVDGKCSRSRQLHKWVAGQTSFVKPYFGLYLSFFARAKSSSALALYVRPRL